MPPVEVDALEHRIPLRRMVFGIECLIYLREKSPIRIFGSNFQSLPQIFEVVVLANLYTCIRKVFLHRQWQRIHFVADSDGERIFAGLQEAKEFQECVLILR